MHELTNVDKTNESVSSVYIYICITHSFAQGQLDPLKLTVRSDLPTTCMVLNLLRVVEINPEYMLERSDGFRPANPPKFSRIIPEISLYSRSPGILLNNPGYFNIALLALCALLL